MYLINGNHGFIVFLIIVIWGLDIFTPHRLHSQWGISVDRQVMMHCWHHNVLIWRRCDGMAYLPKVFSGTRESPRFLGWCCCAANEKYRIRTCNGPMICKISAWYDKVQVSCANLKSRSMVLIRFAFFFLQNEESLASQNAFHCLKQQCIRLGVLTQIRKVSDCTRYMQKRNRKNTYKIQIMFKVSNWLN